MVEDEADDGCQGHDRLHGDPGRRMDGAHENAHGRHPEVGAHELEPLRPREPGFDPARTDAREGYTHQTLVFTPRQHEERVSGDLQVVETLVEGFQRPQVLRDGPKGVVTRSAHDSPILPRTRTSQSVAWTILASSVPTCSSVTHS